LKRRGGFLPSSDEEYEKAKEIAGIQESASYY
jgi:hypothetical protein